MDPKLFKSLFGDTITGRMLRDLALATLMPQRDFMRRYADRCARTPTRHCKPNKAGVVKPNNSSLQNNFGRFLIGSAWGTGDAWFDSRRRWPLRVIERQLANLELEYHSTTNPLIMIWRAGNAVSMIRGLSDDQLQDAYARMERAMVPPTGFPTFATDDPERDFGPWVISLRAEIARRCQNGPSERVLAA